MVSDATKRRLAKRNRIYRKRIPYGMMNFVTVRRDDCYYVDKTEFIEEIEDSNKFFFFIRPRRFGKSLTLSMLKQYYDVNMADRFEELFGGLYIGENPTPEHNTYLIISLNFAVVDANLENYKKGLDAHCNTEFNFFCDVYAQYLPAGIKEEMNKKDGAAEQLDYLCKECKKTGQKVYLFIDEYDHFTNTILAEPDCLNSYKAETHGTGYLRKFFDTIKSATDNTLERVFVTGVSPVTMDDLTSGFNIGTNYSLEYEFNEMTGFPAEQIADPDNFVSLLYYFGMVTIAGTYKGKTKFVIPNQVVREQIFRYLLDTYKENDLEYNAYEKGNLESELAYEGKWKPYFQYIADRLHQYSSQRDHQKGEYFVHGFTLAMTCDNKFYRPISEKDTQEGYADIFLCPLVESFSDMQDSYIVELKYAKSKDTDAHVQQLYQDALVQVHRYAESEVVTSAIKTTKLHKIIVIYKGTEMVVCEEV